MTVFAVDVFHTDRTRNPDRSFVIFRSRVSVQANCPLDATWTAIAMVIGHPARQALDVMPVDAQIVL